ncbi:50S ribosomal protein L23 [Thiotrichales bacterium HSG1]|nr:50S ribosomal protein L23 [Thiotrichales bacterium HSG1]
MNQARLLKVLIAPHISEKASYLADNKQQFIFKILPNATKPEVKQAVELLFDVKVKAVRVCNVKGKRKTFGKAQGKRANWKKAYVGLEPGFDIRFRDTE